jgi:phosphoribulokinase
VVIRFKNPRKWPVHFPEMLAMVQGSFMSRRNTIVVPGGKMGMAMEIILMPILEQIMRTRDNARRRSRKKISPPETR